MTEFKNSIEKAGEKLALRSWLFLCLDFLIENQRPK
jgi:DNA-binding winged helix-turn-helix (wHTH) protein